MKQSMTVLKNENGMLLVIVLIILALLTLIGIAITTTASLEMQIASNDRLHKDAFYRADGGGDIGFEMLEQNIGCAGGFTSSTISSTDPPDPSQSVQIVNNNFWQNLTSTTPTAANRDFYFPSSNPNSVPRTDFTVGGNTSFSTGNAIQMVSGYEGKGKAAAAGGGIIIYDMYTKYMGSNNNESTIFTQWRHVIGQEGDCNY